MKLSPSMSLRVLVRNIIVGRTNKWNRSWSGLFSFTEMKYFVMHQWQCHHV